MATNSNNLEPAFDALLKAHVQQQANVAACTRFDPDSAAAYLERALSQAALAAFEAHLSTCAACRRHVIELSRLMPPPTQVTEPIIARATFPERWREWFSGWRLGALAGLGAVAATVLVIAVAVNRSDNNSIVALRQPEAQASPLPEPSSQTFGQTSGQTIGKEAQSGAEKPTASSSPATSTLWGNSKDVVLNAPAAPREVAPPHQPARTVDSAAATIPPPPPQPPPAPSKAESERKEAAPPVQTAAGVATSSSQANQFRAQPPSGPEANQMQAERALEARKRNEAANQAAEAPAPSAAKPVAKSSVGAEDRPAGTRKDPLADEADETAKKRAVPRSAAAKEKSAERPARPERTIAGKTFRQESGVWIDNDYKPGNNLPVVRLKRDSDEYQQTLKDLPALKPYFDLHPVLVVWQGKVYRVETK